MTREGRGLVKALISVYQLFSENSCHQGVEGLTKSLARLWSIGEGRLILDNDILRWLVRFLYLGQLCVILRALPGDSCGKWQSRSWGCDDRQVR